MSFPIVEYEKRKWNSLAGARTEREFLQMSMPYKAALLKPIAALDIEIPASLQNHYLSTLENVARFDAMLEQKSVVMPAILLRSESASSSQIEHLTASAKNIAVAQLGGKTKDNANLVAGNIRAMKKALDHANDFSLDSILQIHKALLEDSAPEIAGRVREQQVWIGGKMSSPHDAKYVAPHHENVMKYLKDFIEFANRRDIPPFVLIAIAHAQFETIHPFADGNGRTGRALVQLMLHRRMVVRKANLPLSAGFLGRPKEYFNALEVFRNGDIIPIIEEFLIGADLAIEASVETVDKLEKLRTKWREQIKARKDSAVWNAIELLLEQPVIDAKYVSNTLRITDMAARSSIDILLESEIIKPIKDQKRNVMYCANEVAEIMDNFGRLIQYRRHS